MFCKQLLTQGQILGDFNFAWMKSVSQVVVVAFRVGKWLYHNCREKNQGTVFMGLHWHLPKQKYSRIMINNCQFQVSSGKKCFCEVLHQSHRILMAFFVLWLFWNCRALPSSLFLLWFFATGCQTLISINDLEWTHCCVWLWCHPKPELVAHVWHRFWVMFISSWVSNVSNGLLLLLSKSKPWAQGPFTQYMCLYIQNCKHWASSIIHY